MVLCHSAWANDIVRIVVPVAPGGGMDITARKLAPLIERDLNATVIVENVPGAGTKVGTDAVTKSDPNGKTILINSVGALESISQSWEKDLTPVAIITPLTPWVLVANNKYQNLSQLVNAMKTQPVNFGSSTVNGNHVILVKMLVRESRIKNSNVETVIYKSTPAIVNDVMAGNLDAMFATAATVHNLVVTGKVTALAVVDPQRLSYLPDVPTFAELGFKNFTVGQDYYGLWVPSSTSSDTVQKIRKIVNVYTLNNGLLHQEFAAMKFINSTYTIPADPTAEQQRAAQMVKRLQQEFFK